VPLPPGTRIGGYDVVALLGAGGMGEVYRARDSRLGRDIAIKILSPHIAADADALARFDREARALASLNHPNIAAIYGVEDNGTQPALILELVTGTTLAARIARGPLAIGDTIAYAEQIAEALDVAHESGIVHRDLKPGNIVITDDGRVKVLDFGLAKAIAAAAGDSPDLDPANSPTITFRGTQHGVILGTAAYMSPEQARGKRIDKRTDIWAFGCVLYEMLTGTRAFSGETTSDVIAAILERAPDLNRLPHATPPHLRRVVERCLEKDPKRRARDIADVRSDLGRDEPAPPARRSWVLVGVSTLIAGVAIGVAGLLWSWRTVAVAPSAPIEFTLTAPAGYALLSVAGIPSPDGSRIAFLARDDKSVPSIFVRALDAAASRRLEGTEGTESVPVWSPDGRAIAFFVSGVWKRVPVDGGPPVTIVANVVANLGASWGAGDLFLVAPANRTSLARVQVTGGSLQPVTTLDTAKDNSHRWPTLLPDGRHYLFTVRSDSPERLGIKLGALDSTEVRSLVNVASQGVFAQPGWLLYVTPDEVLMAQRLDPASSGVEGAPQPVVGPVRYNGPSFQGAFYGSVDGRVVTYIPSVRGASTLEWFDRTGKALGQVGPARDYRGLRLSRDGRQIAVELADPQVGTRDLWTIDTSTQALTRFTSHPATDWRAVFAPDGSAIAFASDRAGVSTVFRGSTRSPGPETPLHRAAEGGAFPMDWSRDGKSLLVTHDDKDGRPSAVALVPVGGGAQSVVIANEPAVTPRLSPDGTRIAFVGIGAGGPEVYMMSIADKERIPISTDGGRNPSWSADGRELFFLNRGFAIMRAVIDGKTLVGRPEVLFRPCDALGRSFSGGVTDDAYDVTADGARFLAVCDAPGTVPSAINVIVNWQGRLK
jgi:eukaryotic-like serine/threonine-protein kinase